MSARHEATLMATSLLLKGVSDLAGSWCGHMHKDSTSYAAHGERLHLTLDIIPKISSTLTKCLSEQQKTLRLKQDPHRAPLTSLRRARGEGHLNPYERALICKRVEFITEELVKARVNEEEAAHEARRQVQEEVGLHRSSLWRILGSKEKLEAGARVKGTFYVHRDS